MPLPETAAMPVNALGQPLGMPVPGWTPRPLPPRAPAEGRFCRLEPLAAAAHAADLWEAHGHDREGANWTYLPVGPHDSPDAFRAWAVGAEASDDPQFYAVIDARTGRAVGSLSFLRMDPAHGVIEIGFVHFSPLMQRTAMATEAQYLLMRRAFDELGYRRLEWKCNALNAPSRVAAERLGYTFEGTFRQARVEKGHNRDTAWYSLMDEEWPARRAAFETWLDPANFDGEGRQRRSLRDLMAQAAPS